MKLSEWNHKPHLIVRFEPSSLSVVYLKGAVIEKAGHFLIREMPRDAVRKSLLAFLDGRKVSGVLAVLARSEILQKEFTLAKGTEDAVKEELDSKLHTLLPFSVKEMAWGLRMEPEGDRMEGVLMAAPEKKIRELIAFLKDVGLDTQDLEVVTEDQALLWASLERKETGPALLLDKKGPKILALFLKDGRLSFSRTFEGEDAPEDMLTELSLRLLESEIKARKIILSGDWNESERRKIEKYFSAPVETFLMPALPPAFEITVPLYGASLFRKYPRISLLPKEEKIARRLRERKTAFRDIAIVFLMLIVLFTAASLGQLFGLKQANARIDQRIAGLSGSAAEAETVVSALRVIRKSQASKENILSLLKELAQNAPSGVRMHELRVEGGKVQFFGESPSYGPVSETVEMLEQTGAIEGAKLRGTRLRKSAEENFLEFEVTGQWSL